MKTNLNTHLSMHRNRHKTIKIDKNLSLRKHCHIPCTGNTQTLAMDIQMLSSILSFGC